MNIEVLLKVAKEAAKEAGKEILKIYETDDFSIESKTDDSPLTKADRAAHNTIVSFLKSTDLPILSEEGRDIPYSERKKWDYFWLVDPLDGTKEFIKKNGEFTVNIALILDGRPIAGVVYTPVLDELFWACEGKGAFKVEDDNDKILKTSKKKLSDQDLKVMASRSHMNEETQHFVTQLNQPEIVSKGSSLKFLLIASSEADVYPRFGPTMEWDTAAADIIVREAGGRVVLTDEITPLSYNSSYRSSKSSSSFSKAQSNDSFGW